MVNELYGLLILALGMGIVHALDADHILAVSVLSSDENSFSQSLWHAIKWSLGHGLMLLCIVVVLTLIGQVIPVYISEIAEQLIGTVLITLGLYLFYHLKKQNFSIHFHHHQGLLPHAHWLPVENKATINYTHKHKAYLIGSLHGVAGSAPLLAMIPVVQGGQFINSVVFLLVFSIGVFISMLCFGGIFAAVMKKLVDSGRAYALVARSVIALLSIVMGVHLVSA